MGCRLHWASTYKINWEGGWFNYNAEKFRDCLRQLEIEVWECVIEGGDYDDIEISIDEFKRLKDIVAEMRDTEDYEKPIIMDDNDCPTYKDFDEFIKRVEKSYDKDNSFIHFTWF